MDKINKAVEVLNNGGIIIFPTDTAFGIGCRIDNENAIKRLFRVRKRPQNQATPVLVSSVDMANKYLIHIPKKVREELIDNYWPGALTIILPCKKEKVPDLVRGGGGNLGVRMPNDKQIQEVIEKVGVPILGPSANFHKEQTPYSISEVNKKLVHQVDFVLEGNVYIKKTSTVIDCSQNPWKILREGAININI